MDGFTLIVTIVNKGYAEQVMDAARGEGATGGTILCGRGTGSEETAKFYGITLHSEKETVLIVAKNDKKSDIMTAIAKEVGIDTKGQGVIFSLPVEDTLGFSETAPIE